MANLQKARTEFSNVLDYLFDKLPALKPSDLDKYGYQEFAAQISDPRLKAMFREAAQVLLQESILDHLASPPKLKEIRSAAAIRELREWRETLLTWESGLNAIRDHGDT